MHAATRWSWSFFLVCGVGCGPVLVDNRPAQDGEGCEPHVEQSCGPSLRCNLNTVEPGASWECLPDGGAGLGSTCELSEDCIDGLECLYTSTELEYCVDEKDGFRRVGGRCSADEDCVAPAVCSLANVGKCEPRCVTDEDCSPGQECSEYLTVVAGVLEQAYSLCAPRN